MSLNALHVSIIQGTLVLNHTNSPDEPLTICRIYHLSMSSQDPPGRKEKHGVRRALQSGYTWVKGLGRPSSTPPISAHQGSLTIPSSGFRNLSLSRLTGSAPSISMAWNRLGTSLRVFEGRLGVFPPLKSAVDGLIGCLDVVQVGQGIFHSARPRYLTAARIGSCVESRRL